MGTFLSSVRVRDALSEKIESFWQLESLGIREEESTVLADFHNTIEYIGERYIAKLPWNEILQEQVRTGILEEVPEEEIKTNKRCHYPPHHATLREDKDTTKLRVGLDGAARSSRFDFSMNDCLSKGPNLLVSLLAILLRFRMFQVTVLRKLFFRSVSIQMTSTL